MGVIYGPALPANGATADGDVLATLFTDIQTWSNNIPRDDLEHRWALFGLDRMSERDIQANTVQELQWLNNDGEEWYLWSAQVMCRSVPGAETFDVNLQNDLVATGWTDMFTADIAFSNAVQNQVLQPAGLQNRTVANSKGIRLVIRNGVFGAGPYSSGLSVLLKFATKHVKA